MTITYVGSLSIGHAVPGCDTAVASGTLGVNTAIPDLQGRIDGLAAAIAAPPPPVDFGAQLALANQILTAVEQALALSLAVPPTLTPPNTAAQVAAFQALLTDLQANLVSVNAQLSVLGAIGGLLVHAGLHVYAYAGPVNGFGGALTAELNTGLPGGGSPTDDCNAIGLITTSTSTWAAMQQIFKVVP